ncbi:MAG: hypothetical protein MJY62_01970 [Bacteroidales bacterium]|nr:hypothetical protein [Bacteroidales bacterium]
MKFSEVVGNDALKHTLSGMVDSGRVPQALLLYENDGHGAFPLAMAFLQYLSCHNRSDGDSCGCCPVCGRVSKMIHPDIHFVFPTNTGSKSGSLASKDVVSDIYMNDFRNLALRNPYFTGEELCDAIGVQGKTTDINVAEASSIIRNLSLTPLEDGYRSVVIYLPEKMGVQAANKLLKILEEPPQKTIFVLITHDPEKMLQTIFSRCQSARVLPLSREQWALVHKDAESENDEFPRECFNNLVSCIINRDFLGALSVGESLADLKDREKQKAFCIFASKELRKIFMIQQKMNNFAFCLPSEEADMVKFAAALKKTWPRQAQTMLDSAVMLLERNVNQKILFCDLVVRMFSI